MSSILKFFRENHILALIEQAIAKKKSRLSLNAFEISEIPSLLYTCLEVEHLYLHKNKITTIPVEITQLINLTTLTLDYNNINSLPPEIGNLKNLVNLNISYNPLNVLIPEIGDLENLEAFWCNRIGLREIPKEIGKLEKLDTFGARGNELKTIPEEMTRLSKLRWLTLENNHIEVLPSTMDKLEALVHCNLRNNRINEFPASMLKCTELMFLQLNNNQVIIAFTRVITEAILVEADADVQKLTSMDTEISYLPEDFDTSFLTALEMIDLRSNPICELSHPIHPLVRYTEELPTTEGPLPELSPSSSRPLAVNGTALRLPALPAHPAPPAPHAGPAPRRPDPMIIEMDLDASSVESSEDWENSVNSSELDVQYQSDEEGVDNEAVGAVLPDLSRYASTAS